VAHYNHFRAHHQEFFYGGDRSIKPKQTRWILGIFDIKISAKQNSLILKNSRMCMTQVSHYQASL